MIARDRVIGEWQIEQDGYAILANVLAPHEVEQLLVSLQDAESHHRSRAGIRHLLKHPAVSQIANDPRMLELSQSVLGHNAFPFRATLFDKSSEANWLITWHQDTALPLREKHEIPGWGPWSVKEGVTYAHAPASVLEKVVALRLHLDDSTDQNGPLRVIPGTHSNGVLHDSEVESIVAKSEPVTCTVAKGGVVVMRPLVIHASSKSQSDVPRRVLHIEYAAGKEFFPGVELAIA
ncbi:MAG TPA: phytanoyl-CoA dioxygenase family protein [Candidatus Angelobacter sp.]|nr:phytanoyl-CoA dioxygenase family protein [Candidatus Angelobacter sp.]